ncbi:alpha/beta fold hydrolase [Marinobacter sp.]|uniref:alpha/beta fold hydrolase n=1 Tax=Marinobacter sp. TaxID=50741 RepID=UPI001990F703|nr:alpha/beta fold hydrolase [Marinobacter sp.]MBC7191505.1 alpha/beta fold hydrolase [Marinobacter sp.]
MNQRHWIDNAGVRLFARTWGDSTHPAMVLVHGYPDNHSVWSRVAEHLANRFFVIAWDVRGAGASDAPSRLRDYRLSRLASDMQAVVDQLIPERDFHLAAHDWGSVQSWESVTDGPLTGRIRSFTSISGPCLDHVGFVLRRKALSLSLADKESLLRQLGSSWYVMFFQLPVFAPLLWKTLLAKRWPEYLANVEGVAEPEPNPTQVKDGSKGVMLYRANMLPRLLNPRPRYARCPVQLIEPRNDRYVGPVLSEQLEQWVPGLIRRPVEAGHWLILDQPEQVAGWIAGFADTVA